MQKKVGGEGGSGRGGKGVGRGRGLVGSKVGGDVGYGDVNQE